MTEKKADEASYTGLNLYQKLAKITGEIGAVAKDGNNSEQNFKFIEYAAVAGKLRVLFAKYGVVVVPRMQQSKKQNRTTVTSKYGKQGYYVLIDMYFDVVNADNPSDHFTVQWTGEAADYGDKATNKAATGALKYYLMRQFNISEKGEDADEDSHEIVSKAPAAKPAVGSAPAKAPAVDPNAISAQQLKMMMALFNELGLKDKAEQATYIEKVAGKKLASKKDLTKGLATKVIDTLKNDIAAVATPVGDLPAEEDIEDGDIASLLDAADEGVQS